MASSEVSPLSYFTAMRSHNGSISNTEKLHFNKLHELWYLIQSPRLENDVHLEMGLPCTVETHSLLGTPFGVY